MSDRQPADRFTGAMLALACGDALGAPAEFLTREQMKERFGRLTEMVGGGSFGWAPGEWTDDTGMALCVAEGILEAPEDPISAVGERFLEWRKTAKDVGGTIAAALAGFQGDWAVAAKRTPQALEGKAAGNGSLMRTLPVALAYPDRDGMLRQSARISAMTHWDPQAEVCCAVYCLWVRAVLEGGDLEAAWEMALAAGQEAAAEGARSPGTPGPSPLPEDFWERLRSAPAKSYSELQPGGYAGYVVDCLEAAVCCSFAEVSLEDALVAVVNLAGETDTMAAVAGGVGGAESGVQALPSRWLEVLRERERIERAGRQLASLRHRLVYRKPSLPKLEMFEAGDALVAGRNPLTGEDVAALLECGVTAVLDLREELEWTRPGFFGRDAVAALSWCDVRRLNLPIPDGGAPRAEDLDQACAFLDDQLAEAQAKAYVHCRAGRERTAAVLVAWVARRHGIGYDAALERIRASGCPAGPLPGQERAVRRWLGETD